MKTILTNQQKKDFLNENWRLTTLSFKWSRAGVCRIYDRRNEKTEFNAGGYGYDKKGTALGNLINTYFSEELKKLPSETGGKAFSKKKGFYGLTHYNPKGKSNSRRYLKRSTPNTRSYVDGGCGFNSMKSILWKIGFKLTFVKESSNELIYTLSAK
tara:strand:+ start:481 stop:948 length:468 start_codon:yes stop_codon:yes gene_type:complete